MRMRIILTFGAFLILICSAAGQIHRDGLALRQSRTDKSLLKCQEIRNPFCHPTDTINVVFTGDMMMHSAQIINARNAENQFDFSECFSKTRHLIQEADIAVANMEFTLAGEPYTGYPCFSAPDSFAEATAECGVDVFLTANNHILDKGRKGAERTLGIYSDMEKGKGIRHAGSAVSPEDDSLRFPLKILAKGIRLALINFTYGTNIRIREAFPKVHLADTAEIAAAIRRAKDTGADFIIALPHWGNEYALRHSERQGKLARWLADNGCDAVIGTHPHVIQDMETLSVHRKDGSGECKVPVIYSLGNFISNMSAPNTQVGMIATLSFTKDWLGDCDMLEPRLTLIWCSRPGHLARGYTTIPIKEYVGKRGLWINQWDYHKMITSYERVKKETGIID